MSQQIVAIDVSSRAVRVVTVETTLRKTEIVSAETFPISEEEPREQVLTKLGESLNADCSIVVSCDSRAVSTRLLHFPFADLRKVEAAIDFELEGQVPYDLEETAITWKVVGRATNSTEVLACLTPKAVLSERLAELSSCGLEARAIVLADASLAELVSSTDETLAVLSLGHTTCHMAIVKNGVRVARTLRAGGTDVDRVVARELGIGLEDAHAIVERDGQLLAGEDAVASKLSSAILQGLGPLISSLVTTFKALPPTEAPARMLLTGGLSRLPGIVELLGERLGVPVELLDLKAVADTCGSSLEAIAPEYGLALGMALGMMRQGRQVALNFRRGALAYQGDIQLYRGQLTRIAMGLGAVILLGIFGSVVRYSMISSEERRIDKGFCEATKRIVGREICDPTAALATVRQAPGGDDGVVIPAYSAGTLLEMMSKVIGKDIDVTFDEMEIRVDARAGDSDRISAQGEAASFESTEQLVTNLKRDPCVQEAEVSKQRKARDGGHVEFNLNIKISCPPGVPPGSAAAVASVTPATEEKLP